MPHAAAVRSLCCLLLACAPALAQNVADTSEQKLLQIEKALARVIVHNGADATVIARQIAALDAAGREFRTYRTRQCSLQTVFNPADAAARERRVACEVTLNEARALDLQTTIDIQKLLAR
jgi:Lysozyme inhibitor LprI